MWPSKIQYYCCRLVIPPLEVWGTKRSFSAFMFSLQSCWFNSHYLYLQIQRRIAILSAPSPNNYLQPSWGSAWQLNYFKRITKMQIYPNKHLGIIEIVVYYAQYSCFISFCFATLAQHIWFPLSSPSCTPLSKKYIFSSFVSTHFLSDDSLASGMYEYSLLIYFALQWPLYLQHWESLVTRRSCLTQTRERTR